MPFTIHITRDFDQMSWVAAEIAQAAMSRRLAEADGFVLGLATGSSPTGLYKHLAKAANSGVVDATRVRTFNLDEYVGLPGENAQQRTLHPESYSFFMTTELFGLTSPRFAETNLPWGTLIEQDQLQEALAAGTGYELAGSGAGRAVVIAPDAEGYLGWVREQVLEAYAAKIAAAGGIDLHVIGVGGRGHVAFHESGIPFDAAPVLLVQLDENTMTNAVTDGHFATIDEVPHFAISMGAELVFEARQVLMVASGSRKTGPVTEAVLGEVTCDVPLSYAQTYAERGGEVTFVLDEIAAAGLLERADEVTARGIELVDRRDQDYPLVESLSFQRDPGTGMLR